MTYAVAAFYQFVTIDDPQALRERLAQACCRARILGTVLIAPEGINGTIAAASADLAAFIAELEADPRFTGLDIKYSQSVAKPFQRMKVKLKREIVTFGVPEANPAKAVGTYVDAADWNALISDPDVVLIDTRNAYEFKVGTFAGAHDPGTRSFSEFPAYVAAALDPAKHKKIAMFCTGGIRCEKASSFMLQQGFAEVYHLKGGILKYLEVIPPDQSLWQGECFVFDERVALGTGVTEGETRLCKSCGSPLVGAEPCENCSAVASAPRPSTA